MLRPGLHGSRRRGEALASSIKQHQATSSNLPASLLMFRRTLMRSAQEVRKPMIRFPDRKSAPKGGEYATCDDVRVAHVTSSLPTPPQTTSRILTPPHHRKWQRTLATSRRSFKPDPIFTRKRFRRRRLRRLPRRRPGARFLMICTTCEREMDAINVSGQHGELGNWAAC